MSDLTSPLGLGTPGNDRKRPPYGVIASVTVVAVAAAVVLWVIAVDNPFGGEPLAVATIEDVNGGIGRDEVTVVGVKSGSGQILPPVGSTATDPVEVEAVRPPSGSGGVRITLPDGSVTALSLPTTPLPELTEEGPGGPLPRIGEDGTRPLDAYARPVSGLVGASPKVVVIVGGLGLSQTGTQEALRQLPPDVTLAFAPYGSSLDRWTARARQDGHELLLQVPLEPFDYPDNDPGPETLLTDAPAEKNLDNLHWLMGRIGTYVGVMSYMGARFTADEAALEPVMTELTARGLMFVDEGSSLRTKSAGVAAARQTAYAKGDIVIDAVTSPEEIAGRLAQLEQIARSRGLAVGVASALPVSVRSIAEWAATLERRGITLVPVSASLGPPA